MAQQSQPHGVRVTARLFGDVVVQAVHWPASKGIVVGRGPQDALPTHGGAGLVRLTWHEPGVVAVEPIDPSAESGTLGAGEGAAWTWSNGQGVEVDLELVPRRWAQRMPSHASADVAMAVVILMLLVGVTQLTILAEVLMGRHSASGLETAPEPTPEYIARLLTRDLDGADEGVPERADRPEYSTTNQSFYLPSGSQGPLDRSGGGAVAGEVVQRDEPVEVPEPEDLTEGDADSLAMDGAPDTLTLPEAPPAELELLGGDAPAPDAVVERTSDPLMERFVGWGFKDWFDVSDARPEQKAVWEEQLELARVRLKINPDDPYALNTVGLYAYLAENHELSRVSYERMMELHPDTPAAYNNLALVLKRSGEYADEEALYRQALELDPYDTHVLNNLAVCLAHQGRYDEALAVMDRLDELSPEDTYADLHRSKIYAAMGKKRRSLRYLERALEQVPDLDSLHHIEFRQDLRLDPVFDAIRGDKRFRTLIEDAYGDDAEYLLSSGGRRAMEGPHG